MKRKGVFYVISILSIAAILAGILKGRVKQSVQAQEDNREAIKVAYLPTTHSLALLAQAELEKENPFYRIELVQYGTWPDLSDALNTGKVDGAVELAELAMKAIENELPLKAVLLGHRDGNIVVINKSIHNVQELKGKAFAIPSKLSSHNILVQGMLLRNGFDKNDINVIELSPAEMPFALASGQIAGYCVAEPFGGKAVHAGVARVLYESDDLWENSICCTLVFQENFLKKRKLAGQFLKDYKDAGTYLDEHPEQAKSIGEKYLGLDKGLLSESLRWITFHDLDITKRDYNVLGEKIISDGIMAKLPEFDTFTDKTDSGSEEKEQ